MPDQSPSARSSEFLTAHVPGAFPDTRSLSSPSITTQQTSLSQALYDRRAEYTRPRTLRIKIGTWNTGAQKGTEHDVSGWFVKGKGVEEALAGLGTNQEERETVHAQEARRARYAPTLPYHDGGSLPGNEDIGLYVLGLQEIVDITSGVEALRPYHDPSVAKKWKDSIEASLPTDYQLVAEQQLIGLFLVIYASAQVFPQIQNVSTTSCGTGLMGYMGNKGAVTTRIVLGETTRLVFINAHLAAGTDKASLDRRNWDAGQVAARTRFDPVVDALGTSQHQGESLGEEDFAFWFGDLNYRLEGMPGDDVRRLLTIHTTNLDKNARESSEGRPSTSNDSMYGSKSSSKEDSVPLPPDLDPASLQTTIASLLPHDELHQQMKNGKAFQDGWQEGPIRFLPSYKYDVGKVGVFDSSEKRRCPSWCDRILYRTRAAKQAYDAKAKEEQAARKRDEEMKAKGMGDADDDDILFDYDPETDGDNTTSHDDYNGDQDPEPQPILTNDGLSDELLLEYYTTHMRVLSSDHKPLDAVFSLKYDAVVPDLKTTVHGEIARELDRQENEGRPSIAVVVERATDSNGDQDKTDSTYEGVDFGDVKFAKSKRRNITIANTGRVPATFGFADRPVGNDQAAGPFPEWLSVTFDREPDKVNGTKPGADDVHERFTLEPADVINAELRLKIENVSAVRDLNEAAVTLEEVLVLRVEEGRDHFLPLRANWLQSALARTVDKLIKIPEGGIRKLQHQVPNRDEVKWSSPREIFRLTETIEDLIERALAAWGMTSDGAKRAPWQDNAGWPFVKNSTSVPGEGDAGNEELADVFDALDCDMSIKDALRPETQTTEQVEIVADALIRFLSSLVDGVVTKSLWEKMEEGLLTREKSRQQQFEDDEKMWILELMASAPNHNATFLLLLSFLQNLTGQITDSAKPKAVTPRTSVDLPSSPTVKVRRRALSKVPEVAVRQLIVRNYAVTFADVIFRASDDAKMRERDKAVRKERMVRVLELFLSSEAH